MHKWDFDEAILSRIKQLEEKYEAMGQDLASYLDGLLYADYLTYWDYIHLDALLSLQNPRTNFADEPIFIIYHQITELYFKLSITEMRQLIDGAPAPDEFLLRMKRINRYIMHLEDSFDIMIDGMDKEQFLRFRMSLLPASGFQSGQYRIIEILGTDFYNLVALDRRAQKQTDAPIAELYEDIYWKFGATELATGKKTLTLQHFEKKYSEDFIRTGEEVRETNLWKQYQRIVAEYGPQEEIVKELRSFDALINVFWPLAHYKSAVRYLQKDPVDIAATGGTNWQKYLPPRFQKVIFYPELWTDEERESWGKQWVLKEVLKLKD